MTTFDPKKAVHYWVKAPWVNAGVWILYVLPENWQYPAAYAYTQALYTHAFTKGKCKKVSIVLILNTWVEPNLRRHGISKHILKIISDWIPTMMTGAETKISDAALIKYGFKLDSTTGTYIYKKGK